MVQNGVVEQSETDAVSISEQDWTGTDVVKESRLTISPSRNYQPIATNIAQPRHHWLSDTYQAGLFVC